MDPDAIAKRLASYPGVVKTFQSGCTKLRLGLHEEAAEEFDNALHIAPNEPTLLDAKAECFCHLGKFRQALHLASRATDSDPYYESAWVNQSWAHCGLKDYENGLRCAERALDIDAFHESALSNAGIAAMMLGKFEEALSKFDALPELSSNRVIIERYRAICNQRLSDHVLVFGNQTQIHVESLLRGGSAVTVTFDFLDRTTDWKVWIKLTESYDLLRIADTIDRDIKTMEKLRDLFLGIRAYRIAADLEIDIQEKRTKNAG